MAGGGDSGDRLVRELGVIGAALLGLGSIIGTGVFVSTGIAAGVAGPAVILSIAIAAVLATCNGLSSAQLAAVHPVSGGTYEYGYEFLNHWLGFSAGWMFLLAKSASAATAALGFSGYLLVGLGFEDTNLLIPVALAGVAVLTAVVLSGMRRSNFTNMAVVSITLLALLAFIFGGLPSAFENASVNLTPFFPHEGESVMNVQAVLGAGALMFVAYTGYGRIATLGEEVRNPSVTIPRAIIITLVVTALIYIGVAAVGVSSAGAEAMAGATEANAAPLEVISRSFEAGWIPTLLAVGAITAMLGVLLNLILGLSRVLLAMGRRGDAPESTARLNRAKTTPWVAVLVVGAAIAGLVLIGDVRTTWSFSAFTVLVYYSLTNLAALQLDSGQRQFPRWVSWAGLFGCLSLAAFVEWRFLAAGLALLALGLLWHWFRWRGRAEPE